MAARLSSHLVQMALEMAYAQRTPREVIHHSDHGSEPGLNRSSQHRLGSHLTFSKALHSRSV
jgi:hypothetical protein